MKRTTYLVGRIGSNLLVVGLCFFLVYLIPTASLGGAGTIHLFIQPGRFDTPSSDSLSPTRGVHYEAQSNASMRFLILIAYELQIYNWTNTWARDHGGQPFGPPGYYRGYDNYTALQAYLEQYPEQIARDVSSIAGQLVKEEYVPSTQIQVTAVIGNLNSTILIGNLSINYPSAIAPKQSTFLISALLIPVGLILAAPWVVQVYRDRRVTRIAVETIR